jgi:dipeptidase E
VADDIAKRIDTKGKKLAFIYTAAEVEEGGKEADWCQADRKALVDIGFEVTDYTVSGKLKLELEAELAPFDVLYVSGGNTFYLLQQAQQSEFDDVVKKLVNSGKIYIGTSAGSVIAGPNIEATNTIDNAKQAPELSGTVGFNLVNFLIFPHWGSAYFRDLYLDRRLEFSYNENQLPIIILTDRQYVWVKDNAFEIVEVDL